MAWPETGSVPAARRCEMRECLTFAVRAVGMAALVLLVAAALAQAPTEGTDPDAVRSGEVVYGTYCLGCHGEEGRGDGLDGQEMRVRPADLTKLAASAGGEFPQHRVLAIVLGEADGVDAEMMIWCDLLRLSSGSPDTSREQARDVVAYVESLQRLPIEP
jgi:cytochrome c